MTKVVQLSDDAYEALLRQKQPGESFSDVVRRAFPRRPLTDLALLRKEMSAAERAERDRLWDIGRAIQDEEIARFEREWKERDA
jgi:predicted CopG family antitoxin